MEILGHIMRSRKADRKSGPVLHGQDGHVWAIDHGLCFVPDFKLRTVIWEVLAEIAELLDPTAAAARCQRVQLLPFMVNATGKLSF